MGEREQVQNGMRKFTSGYNLMTYLRDSVGKIHKFFTLISPVFCQKNCRTDRESGKEVLMQ